MNSNNNNNGEKHLKITLVFLLLTWLTVSVASNLTDVTLLMQWVEQLPPEVNAAFVTGAILIIGVWLTNRVHTSSQIRQLDHDARERAAERVTALRKDIYFDAIDAAIQLTSHIVKIPIMDLANENPAATMIDYKATTSKMKLIVSKPTVQLLDSLSLFNVKLYNRALSLSPPLNNARLIIKLDEQRLDQLLAQCESKSQYLNQNRSLDPLSMQALNDELTDLITETKKLNNDLSAMKTKYFNDLSVVQEEIFKMSDEADEQQGKLINALRAELDLSGNFDSIKKHSEKIE